MRITIPRWVQLVLIPVAIFLALYFARAASHAVFVFLISAIVALLLNPVVLAMGRVKCPRWLAVPVVYLAAIGIVVVIFIFLGPSAGPAVPATVRRHPRVARLAERAPRRSGDLAGHRTTSTSTCRSTPATSSTGCRPTAPSRWVLWSRWAGAWSGFIVNLFLTVVVSFYMLIDGKRLFRFFCRLAPGGEPGVKEGYVRGLQGAFSKFVRGQALLGATIGLACGLAIWILSWDVVGVWPEGGQYALLFGFWAGLTEVIPYVGPLLGAVPPVIAAFFHSPLTALIIVIVYFVIQQLESHILAPNIVGSSVGVHPLLVIFALLAGAQIGGILGMIASLPLLAMLKHTLTYYDFKMSKAPWAGDDGIVLIPAKSGGPPPRRVRPPGAPEETAADEALWSDAAPATRAPHRPRAEEPAPEQPTPDAQATVERRATDENKQ